MHIDLRPLEDDKTVLKNPHKGWYLHYIDNGMIRSVYRDGIAPGDYLLDFPGLHHLYLRIDWSDIEKADGVFDWSEMDAIMSEWGAKGYKFTFRLCCYETSNPYATPKWVRDAGANGFEVPFEKSNPTLANGVKIMYEPHWEPDYDDPVFLEKLDRFLGEFGRKFNGSPLVEYVDVGTFGIWGEGHLCFSANKKTYGAATMRKHIALHQKHLPDTQLIVNMDTFNTVTRSEGREAADKYAAFCAGIGMGARSDSICVKWHSDTFGYDTMRIPEWFDQFCETAPVDIETDHYARIAPEHLRDCFTELEAFKRAHASFAGFHGYPRPWLEQHRYFTEYAANHLGYWYFIHSLELPECVSGTDAWCRLNIENRGWARGTHPFTLKLRAVAGDSCYLLAEESGANLRWDSEKPVTELVRMNVRGVPAGEYELECGLFENDTPIRLAIKQTCEHDGWYKLCPMTIQAL